MAVAAVIGQDRDDLIVQITVAHGSFEEADYAVMVGCYEDEGFTGAERFLDQQLNGVLTASREAGRYSGPIERAALFIEPVTDPTLTTSPPGAYVIGLGRSFELTRSRLRLAVGQALVARCLHLRTDGLPGCDGERVDVGVSSMLLGVRDNEGLVVSDAVAGIVEGVLDANRSLGAYELARSRRGNPVVRPIRIASLQLIERYSDRADLTGVAVRELGNTVRLSQGYGPMLESTVVKRKRGGLPAGSTLVDGQQDWRRFSITSAAGSPSPTADEPTLRFDVSLLGGDARADRVVHDLDRVAVEALTSQLSRDSTDQQSAATLYDLLVPQQMSKSFQSLCTVQLIVDETSANYPWELLGAPRPGGMIPSANQGSIIRQFSETGRVRLVTERARRGTALIIAAGKVQGQEELAGVFDEADEIHKLLLETTAFEHGVEYLSDAADPLSTVQLVNALDGDHQILHIASHGEFAAGDSVATGALLNDGWRLRVETVRQIRQVPDLVFLNCCSLGMVGKNRLAAGLAREFMAIGCRAVIAAGWSVHDEAAQAFAHTFYKSFLEGAAFGDAVAAARISCARTGKGRQTWAAYQCYGDPTFVLGDVAPSRSTSRNPVSADDLLRHLETLDVRASDLGRSWITRLGERRAQLVTTRAELEKCFDEGLLNSPGADIGRTEIRIQRLLAKVAAELGELRVAASRYLRLVEPTESQDGDSSAPTRWTTLEDVQQASNCLSRAAVLDVRASDSAGCTDELKQDLLHAVALAERALDLSAEGESWGILAGALKRLATVEAGAERARLIHRSADAYQRRVFSADVPNDRGRTGAPHADDGHADEAYTRHNAAQLALVLDQGAAIEVKPAAPPTPAVTIVDERVMSFENYWQAATFGDELLTRLLAAPPDSDAEELLGDMISAYERAFASRSTWRERGSTLEHLRDLHELLREDDRRRESIAEAIGRLEHWEEQYVGGTAAPAETISDHIAATRARPGAVTVTALPAGPGDCLILTYGDPGAKHRMLIDGGVASAYTNGLGTYIANEPGGKLYVDTVVVTHIDNDHIVGIVKAFEAGVLEAGDVWFNGRDALNGLGTRGVRLGDQLSELLPIDRRNRIVNGAALLVPDHDALPTLDLPGGATCTLLTPHNAALTKLCDRWKTLSSNRSMSQVPLDQLADALDDETGERGQSPKEFGGDTSIANGSSIAFLFEYQETALLLTADAFAPDLASSLTRLCEQRQSERIDVGLFKLSHHGSVKNITPALLQLVNPEKVLICTDGERHHPDQETINLLATSYPDVPVQFVGRGPKIIAAEQRLGSRAHPPPEDGVAVITFQPDDR